MAKIKVFCVVVAAMFLIPPVSMMQNVGSVDSDSNTMEKIVSFSEPTISSKGDYLNIEVKEARSALMRTGEPIIPVYTFTTAFPFGTKIIDIDCDLSPIKTMRISKKIEPSPEPIPLSIAIDNYVPKEQMDPAIYESSNPFPTNWYSYHMGAGLDGDRHVLFLTIQLYPVRYIPAENEIEFVNRAKVKVAYEKPNKPLVQDDKYDLVIIAPSKFSDEIQPLIEHKNSYNVRTILVTTEEIYASYDGRDQPEQIKYFIKDAIEKWNISYVLLVGGMKSLLFGTRRDDCNQGSKDWYLPVRYTNLVEFQGLSDPGYISDLYYADIYKADGSFEDWDSDGDGIFAEWTRYVGGKDILDLYPDVYVGRLPCRNRAEVRVMVNKIIHYEKKTSTSDPWFKTMVVVGGDSFDDSPYGTDYYEGEIANQKALDYMSGFEPIKLWASHKDTGEPVPSPSDIIKAVTSGCGFLYFEGHGNPTSWDTHWPHDYRWNNSCGGISIYHMPMLFNGGKLPVCVVGGCHNSEFNVTTLCFLNYWLHKSGWVYYPTPECWSWWLTRKAGGGSIATIGNTGLGYGTVGNFGDLDGDGVDDPDCVERLGGYIERQFWKAYGEDGVSVLGETWGQAVTEYLKTFPGMDYQADCKTVQEWLLIGDPSLQIGGYS